ncbi:ABC transporter permease [Baekduia soli]|uniref:ABC transporter permease n=1 Tax=Baekduia soli TaxID=496014 RepID=UPI001E58A102|nr:ABC transporter permease [Baekduia soli]
MPAGRSVWRLVLDVFLENRLAIAGLAIVVAMVLFCFVGPLIYRTDQIHVMLDQASKPPSGAHPLGTDDTGRDMLGRLMLGGQTSLEVGLAAAVIATFFGALWGAVAGFTGGAVDSLMMRFVDGLLAIPSLFLLLFLASVLTTSVPMLILVVALISWLAPARLVRGETLSLRGLDYVHAVRVMGSRGPWRAILRHIIPNTVGTIVVNVTFQIADAILIVATLSFLGLGVRPPSANWGSLLSDGVTYTANGYWWLVYPPGVAIVLTVVAFNFIGDALRDGLSARLRVR